VIAISDATVHGMPRSEWDARAALSAAKRLIERAGLGTSVWGHASARVPGDPARMLLATFGESFGHARASSLRAVAMHPDALSPAERRDANATAIVLHGAVYAARPDACCVLHTHSPYATALAAAADAAFDAEIIQDAMQFKGRVAYHGFGGVADDAGEMAAVGAAAATADVLFLRNHGVIVIGEDVETAFSRLWYLERCCRTQLLVLVRLRAPIGLRLCQQRFTHFPYHLVCCCTSRIPGSAAVPRWNPLACCNSHSDL
jgi:ribulose-5-phosphate 4-epimerase/fuculose-1-phosphate aldolase